jgi:hypothetical protein
MVSYNVKAPRLNLVWAFEQGMRPARRFPVRRGSDPDAAPRLWERAAPVKVEKRRSILSLQRERERAVAALFEVLLFCEGGCLLRVDDYSLSA